MLHQFFLCLPEERLAPVTAFQDHLTEVKQGRHKYRQDVQEGKREAQQKDVHKFGKVDGMVYQHYSFDFPQVIITNN